MSKHLEFSGSLRRDCKDALVHMATAFPAGSPPVVPIPCAESFWTLESDDSGKYVLITLAKKAMGYMSWEMLLQSDRVDDTITDRVRDSPSI
eukprot:365122-Chlamydomonas_euryale.AAC.40